MRSKTNVILAVSAIALPLVLSSCAKKDEVNPTPQSVTQNASVQVVNGRVVFKDQAAFDQAFKALEQFDSKNGDKKGFDSWEQNLSFSSLRVAAKQEEAHLESLDSQNIPTPAHDLMLSFGFPDSYAAFLNPAGEYQIGQKLFWFHDGFKYHATSETELAAIKQSPSTAEIKTRAGSYTINRGTLNNQAITPASGKNPFAQTNTVVAGSTSSDGRYVYGFNYRDDPGSKRRTIYDIKVFTDDNGTDPSVSYRQFYTVIRLQINYQYFSQSRNDWYRCDGQPFAYQIQTKFSGTPSVPDQADAPTTYTYNTNEASTTNGGYYATTLASATISSYVGFNNKDAGQVQWTFSLNGGISGYPTNPMLDTAHTYSIGSMYYDYPLY